MSKGEEKLNESLSALMDNEATEFECRRVLKECEVNDEIKLKWERFHLLSTAIKGDLDRRINTFAAGHAENQNKESLKSIDLLARINAELDGLEDSAVSDQVLNKQQSINSEAGKFSGYVMRLGQGAIAASVAAIVLFASGTLNPVVAPELELQVAEQTVQDESLPVFDDSYSPSQFSRVPQLNTEFAATDTSDEAARVRLRQAVFQEFVGEPQESIELPVNFNLIIDDEPEE